MLLRRTLLFASAALPAAAATVTTAARTQTGGTARTMRILVPFPPGGTTDILARDLAHVLAESRGAAVVVENKAGAGGIIGSADVARAAPDGTTLLLTATHHVINPSLMRGRLPYDARRDFTPLALIATVPNVLVVHPSVPFQNVGELIEYARANPGKLSFGSTGIGGANHLAGELFNPTYSSGPPILAGGRRHSASARSASGALERRARLDDRCRGLGLQEARLLKGHSRPAAHGPCGTRARAK